MAYSCLAFFFFFWILLWIFFLGLIMLQFKAFLPTSLYERIYKSSALRMKTIRRFSIFSFLKHTKQ